MSGAEARPRTPTAVPDMPRVIPPGHDGNSTDIPRAAEDDGIVEELVLRVRMR